MEEESRSIVHCGGKGDGCDRNWCSSDCGDGSGHDGNGNNIYLRVMKGNTV